MLARTGLVARQRVITPLLIQRNASSSHDEHHHHVEEDTTVYPKEGFTSPAWRRFILASILIGTAYHYAPEPSEESFLTRWIVMYRTSSEKWMDLNAGHTVLSKEAADTFQLFNSAARPPIHRYRYPQMLDNASPFNVPVGLSVDNRHFVAKTEGDDLEYGSKR